MHVRRRHDPDLKRRQAKLQPIAIRQWRLADRLTVDHGPVPRRQIADDKRSRFKRQLAMPPADPAVVDPHAGSGAAADLDGKAINGHFARRRQRTGADKLDLHGGEERRQAGCASGRPERGR
jgi:hypothetical protein